MNIQRKKLNIVKARRRVRMRSALLLTLGVCFVMSIYRAMITLNGTGLIWPTHVFGLTLEVLVTLLAFGGGAYLGLCVLDGDQKKILPRGVLSRAQMLWLAFMGVLLVAPMSLGADVLDKIMHPQWPYAQPFALHVDAPGVFLLTLLKSALLVPVLEELFFRGYLLGALERFGKWRAALVSALCFAAVHMGGKGSSEYVCLMYAAMGLLLAALRLRTSSLLAPMLVHGCYNLTLIMLSSMGIGWLFENLTLFTCALRLGMCAAFVYCLRRAWLARGVNGQIGQMERLTKKELALVIAAGVAVLAAGVLG
ncbi:MAG: CPBP family intramembrane metalloprotease [Clostridiales bacterium]|nr:CPBP family intramembrane metalloprotease [Clostridiales bacterium]